MKLITLTLLIALCGSALAYDPQQQVQEQKRQQQEAQNAQALRNQEFSEFKQAAQPYGHPNLLPLTRKAPEVPRIRSQVDTGTATITTYSDGTQVHCIRVTDNYIQCS